MLCYFHNISIFLLHNLVFFPITIYTTVSVNTPLNLHINGHIEESRKSPTDKSDDDDDDGIDDDNLSDDDKSTGETELQKGRGGGKGRLKIILGLSNPEIIFLISQRNNKL